MARRPPGPPAFRPGHGVRVLSRRSREHPADLRDGRGLDGWCRCRTAYGCSRVAAGEVPLPLVGRAYAGFRRGGNLAPGHAVGRVAFAEFLRDRGA